jgi:hypothetical protein
MGGSADADHLKRPNFCQADHGADVIKIERPDGGDER